MISKAWFNRCARSISSEYQELEKEIHTFAYNKFTSNACVLVSDVRHHWLYRGRPGRMVNRNFAYSCVQTFCRHHCFLVPRVPELLAHTHSTTICTSAYCSFMFARTTRFQPVNFSPILSHIMTALAVTYPVRLHIPQPQSRELSNAIYLSSSPNLAFLTSSAFPDARPRFFTLSAFSFSSGRLFLGPNILRRTSPLL